MGTVSRSLAEEAIASDGDASSAVFITDDSPSQPPALPQSADGGIVFVEDTPAAQPAPTAVAQPQRAAQGELKVVSNYQQQRVLSPVRPVAAPAVRDQPGDVQNALHNAATTTDSPAPKSKPTPVAKIAPMAELLITAHQLSETAETEEQYSRIIQACGEALRLGATGDQLGFATQLSSWAYNRRGQFRADAGDAEAATADFISAINMNARNWRALHNRGVSHAQANEFAEAFDDFNAVIQINPHYAKAYANRATLYVQAKDLQSAIKDYQQAIVLKNDFATAHVGLGRVYHMLGQWDEAVQHFTVAVDLNPQSASIVCSRGDLQADMGRYGEALADYARTIELDPEFAHAYRNGAWLLATCPDERFRDPVNAVMGAKQALEYGYGERHVALDTLAAALASNGQFEEALATLNQAIDAAPEVSKSIYLARFELYQANEPFRTEPVTEVTQVGYEE